MTTGFQWYETSQIKNTGVLAASQTLKTGVGTGRIGETNGLCNETRNEMFLTEIKVIFPGFINLRLHFRAKMSSSSTSTIMRSGFEEGYANFDYKVTI